MSDWDGPYVWTVCEGIATGIQYRVHRVDNWKDTPFGPANFGLKWHEKRIVWRGKVSPVSAAILGKETFICLTGS